ncbi:MAG: hypothetical protein LBE18_05310 [Planctomycetaceae bacterium]|jgi:hypothetical protein|nr:hypothetical protein [Planctomycetaceae bacterium]
MKITILQTKITFEFPDDHQTSSFYPSAVNPFDNFVTKIQSLRRSRDENKLSFTKEPKPILEIKDYGTFFQE